METKGLTAWVRVGQLRTGSWLRANKLKALVLFLTLNVLSATARTSLHGVAGFAVGFVFLFLAIMLGMTYLRGGKPS